MLKSALQDILCQFICAKGRIKYISSARSFKEHVGGFYIQNVIHTQPCFGIQRFGVFQFILIILVKFTIFCALKFANQREIAFEF